MYRRAFTLIELLVTVGIIAVLLGLLMPAMKKLSDQSRQIACLNNLRQIGVGFAEYVVHYEGAFPPVLSWCAYNGSANPTPNISVRGLIPTEMGSNISPSIFRCPADDIQSHPAQPYSYSANWCICSYESGPTIRYAAVQDPSQVILVIDEDSTTIDDLIWAANHYPTDGHNLLSNRHDVASENSTDASSGRGNVLFVDYHAEFIPRLDSTQTSSYLAYPGQAPP